MTRRFVAAVALGVITTALVSAFALNNSRSRGSSRPAPAGNNIAASSGASGFPAMAVAPPRAAQNVRFTIYDVGILPRQAKAQTGKIALAIEDLSGANAELVVAKMINGSAVAAGRVGRSPGSWRGRAVLHLEPGNYQVFDSNRPNNRAELVITP